MKILYAKSYTNEMDIGKVSMDESGINMLTSRWYMDVKLFTKHRLKMCEKINKKLFNDVYYIYSEWQETKSTNIN